jgi:hypothetical protein
MEKFMLIFHGGISPNDSPEQMQENMNKWLAWVDKLAKAGVYAGGEPLLRGGKLVSQSGVTDGPYTEGKEVVGGYFIVNAATFDDAVALCSDYPDFSYGGTIQVRQVLKMDM